MSELTHEEELQQQIDDLHCQIAALERESDDRAADAYQHGYDDGYEAGLDVFSE